MSKQDLNNISFVLYFSLPPSQVSPLSVQVAKDSSKKLLENR